MADFWTVLAQIRDQYPQLVPILSQPGVLAVVGKAIAEGWSATKLQSGLQSTPYYQKTPIEVRQWDVLRATDPATARTKMESADRTIADLEKSTGIKLNRTGGLGSEYFHFTAKAASQGWDANRIKYELLGLKSPAQLTGSIGSDAADIRGMADSYGVPLADSTILQWATQVGQGVQNKDSLRGYMIEQATSRFPGLKDALARGITVRQYADPYLQVAAQELKIDPNTISLTDPKWLRPLTQINQQSGAVVPMSLDEWQKTIRSDSTYGYDRTSGARESATQLATALQQKFGAAA